MPQIPQPQTYTLPPAAPFHNHGRTKAAWVLVAGVSLGVLAAGIGMIFSNQLLILIAAGLVVVTLIASAVMRAVGLGQPDAREEKPAKDWYGD